MDDAKNNPQQLVLQRAPSGLLTRREFQELADVPPEAEA
jgi:hypothetical protein